MSFPVIPSPKGVGSGGAVAVGVSVATGVAVASGVGVAGTLVGSVVEVGSGATVGVDPHAVTTMPVIASPATRKNVRRSIFRCWLFVFVVWLLGVVGISSLSIGW